MALNDKDVARIARLARIELTPEQRAHAQTELNGILHLIERLQSVDTQGVEPLAHPLSAHEDITLRLREDAVTEPSSETRRRNCWPTPRTPRTACSGSQGHRVSHDETRPAHPFEGIAGLRAALAQPVSAVDGAKRAGRRRGRQRPEQLTY